MIALIVRLHNREKMFFYSLRQLIVTIVMISILIVNEQKKKKNTFDYKKTKMIEIYS